MKGEPATQPSASHRRSEDFIRRYGSATNPARMGDGWCLSGGGSPRVFYNRVRSHTRCEICSVSESTLVKSILFVSRQFPPDFVRSVHGVYIRMRVFLEALQEMAESLEMLFYVEEGVDASPAAMQQAEVDIEAFWDIRAKVTLCPVATPDN